jgi:hypothetical protein
MLPKYEASSATFVIAEQPRPGAAAASTEGVLCKKRGVHKDDETCSVCRLRRRGPPACPRRPQPDDDAEVKLWNEGVFEPGHTFIDTLVNIRSSFDFAVFVFTADDWVKSRQSEARPRVIT